MSGCPHTHSFWGYSSQQLLDQKRKDEKEREKGKGRRTGRRKGRGGKERRRRGRGREDLDGGRHSIPVQIIIFKTCSSSSSSCYLGRSLLCIIYSQTLHCDPGAPLSVVTFLYLQCSIKPGNALGTGDPSPPSSDSGIWFSNIFKHWIPLVNLSLHLPLDFEKFLTPIDFSALNSTVDFLEVIYLKFCTAII